MNSNCPYWRSSTGRDRSKPGGGCVDLLECAFLWPEGAYAGSVMDEPPQSSFLRRALLTAAVIFGVLLLYVLSVGPVTYLNIRINGTSSRTGSLLKQFYAPLGWVVTSTPAGQPLLNYLLWWIEAAQPKPAALPPPSTSP